MNITYNCPVCGGEISWDAEANCFRCIYCDGEFTKDQLEMKNASSLEAAQRGEEASHAVEFEEGEIDLFGIESDDGTVGSDLVKYQCGHCYAEMVTDRATAATICVYCGHPMVLTEQITGGFSPKYVIPFKTTKDQAMNKFKEFMRKPLTPKEFFDEVTVDKVQGIYIPFWLFSGAVRFTGDWRTKKLTERKAKGDHDEKRTFSCSRALRAGRMLFQYVPADGSSKTDDEAMQSIEPFNLDELQPFDPAFLSGFLAERFDEDAGAQKSKIKERLENTTHDEVVASIKEPDRVETANFQAKIDYSDVDYALYPTWLLYCTYKNQKYLFAMNGQTGKFIGNLPIDKKKLFTICGIEAIVLLILLILIFLM